MNEASTDWRVCVWSGRLRGEAGPRAQVSPEEWKNVVAPQLSLWVHIAQQSSGEEPDADVLQP